MLSQFACFATLKFLCVYFVFSRSGTKWAHVSCALWIPEVSIGCVEKMEPITKISNIPVSLLQKLEKLLMEYIPIYQKYHLAVFIVFALF